MNIFKVLASGKSSFQEEQASALIAWLLNPRMEHGLGYAFLSRFVDSIAVTCPALGSISSKLSPHLRSGDVDEIYFACHLEYNVQTAFIDIVLIIDDWVLAVENKIYAGSASDQFQLKREYDGLKLHPNCKDKKIGLIFLVPMSDSGLYDPRIELEFSNLSVQESDFKCLLPWQMISLESLSPVPSVSEMIINILAEEARGSIEPIPEYTRHTLKAFNQFILSGFSGYDFQSNSAFGGMNPLTEAVYSITKLSTLNNGYVGVKGGLSGLLQIDLAKLQTQQFQYTTVDMSLKNHWFDIATFNKLVDWRINGNQNEIQWNATLRAPLLYMICKDYGAKVFIGIRGGQKALEQMDSRVIDASQWGIRMSKASSSWIDGQIFYEILSKKYKERRLLIK